MRTFEKGAALYAHEELMSRKPVNWPPTTHPIPTLWERAKALFAATLATIGSAAALGRRYVFRRRERRELLIRLKPVEAIVRALLITEAFTYLLMTQAGQKLWRTAKPCAIPKSALPPEQVAPPPSPTRQAFISAMQAAMQTIACLRPRIDPRIAERAEQKRGDALAAKADASPPARFQVLRWSLDKPIMRDIDDTARSVWIDQLSEPDREIVSPAASRRRADPPPHPAAHTGPAASLASRLDALARVLADPLPAIRRLAARIASVPRGCFEAPYPRRREASFWWHGVPEYFNAVALELRAFRAFERADPRPLDPG